MNYENDRAEKRLNEILDDDVNPPDSSEKKKTRSQADKLVELVSEENCILFHDQFNEPYAHVFINNHWENWKLKCKQFKRWLCAKLWESENKAPSSNAISSALTILESKACFNGERISLENRVTMLDGAIWYDLSNEQWQAVKITAEGWEIVDNPPILFRRYSHQQPQVLPVKNSADLNALLPFVNLAKNEQAQLLPVYVVSCFIPEIPHPIPILYGPQGASKTTLARMLRALIDPSTVGVLSMATGVNELIQQISHHWFAFFDNVTFMPNWASDALCRAVTGEGFSKRELYSDDDDIIYNFRRCIGLNGINLAAKKADLLDRGILFRLDRIAGNQRKGEKLIWKEFEDARPIILGGIFNALSKAMKIYDTIHLEEVPRMADFTIWGCAIAQGLGNSQDEFMTVYYSNIAEQNDEAIHESSVATAVMVFIEREIEWEGSPSELFDELKKIAESENLDAKGLGWPKSVNSLSRRINEVKTNLAEKGIIVESRKISNGKRVIKIQNIAKNTATTATPVTIEEANQIFGGEIMDDEISSPQTSPQNNRPQEKLFDDSGVSGDFSGLPF